jgi:uncharacterized membrane protein YcaP (DUF421 family)
MKPEDIFINDWQRIFVGDVPAGFYAEVILRIAVIYFILMLSMRLMGKRMASQLGRNDMIALVSLAAAIGVPLQSPDRGILAAVVIAAIVVSIQQLVAKLSSKSQKWESITQGDMSPLIEDSCLNLEKMQRAGISRERAFAQLRSKGIGHLGEIKRLYFEAGGNFTVIKRYDVVPGLPILPIWDKEYQHHICTVTDNWVCENCGNTLDGDKVDTQCEKCGSTHRVRAVK